jgi:act minimal PKS chain-length factor (CLF/KS beta)
MTAMAQETLPDREGSVRGAVFTGIGVTSPIGFGTEEHWAATLNGVSGIGPVTRFDASRYPVRLAGEVPSYDPAAYLPGRLVPQTDQMTRLALIATDWALADAAIDLAEFPDDEIGIVTGNSYGGLEFAQRDLEKLWSLGSSKHVSAYLSFAWFFAANTGQISIRHKLHGPGGVLTGHAGGLDSIAHARRYVRDGSSVVVTGAVVSAMCPLGWVADLSTGHVSTCSDPDRAYLPFDTEASGFLPGEGGAILLVEDAASAHARGARPYGAIGGYGATFDPHPDSGRGPGLGRAIRLALADARLNPGDIDVVFADAAGIDALDRAEATAIGEVFGPFGVPVTAPKTMTGWVNAGGPALDVATALLSLRHGVVPPTVNDTRPVEGDRLDLVLGTPRETAVRHALVLARGDGMNSAMVLSAA